MSKLIAALVASMFAAAAFAQTGATPPAQPAAGASTTMEAKKDIATTDKSTAATDKAETKKAKRTARKMKRAEKVGDKPIN